MSIAALVLVLFAALYIGAAIRIASESERFAVIALGRFKKLAGPGLVLRLPGSSEKWVRLKLGDVGTYLGDDLAQLHGIPVPVQVSGAAVNDAIQIASFREGRVWATKAPERVLVCERCGHEMRVGA